MWTVNYVKGGRVVEVKERHLAKIFANLDSVYPKYAGKLPKNGAELAEGAEAPAKDVEELRKECRELLRRKGKIYAVFFKKRLVGIYILECMGMTLVLKHRYLMWMDDLVEAELDSAVKQVLFGEIRQGNYEKVSWKEEVIDISYGEGRSSPAFWISIMIIMLNPLFYTISDNVWPSAGGILLLVMNVMIVVFMILIVRNERKRGMNQ